MKSFQISIIAVVGLFIATCHIFSAEPKALPEIAETLKQMPYDDVLDPKWDKNAGVASSHLYVIGKFRGNNAIQLMEILRNVEYQPYWENAFYALGILGTIGECPVKAHDLAPIIESIEASSTLSEQQKEALAFAGFCAMARIGGTDARDVILGRMQHLSARDDIPHYRELLRRALLSLGYLNAPDAAESIKGLSPQFKEKKHKQEYNAALELSQEEALRRAALKKHAAAKK